MDEAPTFDELRIIRARLNDGVVWCQQRVGKPDMQVRGIERYFNLLYREYLPGIRRHRDMEHDYRADLETVLARLERGMDTAGGDDLFAELLLSYEVLYDILNPDAFERLTDRMTYTRVN